MAEDTSPGDDAPPSSPSPESVLADAEDHLPGRSLTPKEYEHLKRSVAELTPIFRHDRSYFVLGSYGTPEIRRLQLVKDRLNRRPDAYAFLMVDVRREWTNTYLKFRLLADYADLIVGVAEHDGGGFLVEQGTVVTEPAYFEKTHFLKREYDDLPAAAIDTDVDPENPYSGMQTPLFELADDAGRLHRWQTESELEGRVEELP
ncbi:hypothetical protein SAMN06269185_0408 [Natronoarchaeum philippinense]|uniref:Uncharacterized protein n=1 Tax=Natronoarchaeum philippinense TaxID=558529 RepID=A0A285N3D2_NATPI|nr:hypothetical protein [Natronoarchaeum philippinense]SNZ03940.1 hypothetical protein SAMN06269185_0408 [Natronoarchaeum philippinense]